MRHLTLAVDELGYRVAILIFCPGLFSPLSPRDDGRIRAAERKLEPRQSKSRPPLGRRDGMPKAQGSILGSHPLGCLRGSADSNVHGACGHALISRNIRRAPSVRGYLSAGLQQWRTGCERLSSSRAFQPSKHGNPPRRRPSPSPRISSIMVYVLKSEFWLADKTCTTVVCSRGWKDAFFLERMKMGSRSCWNATVRRNRDLPCGSWPGSQRRRTLWCMTTCLQCICGYWGSGGR